MTASSHQSGSIVARRGVWRTPSLTEDAIDDITLNVSNSPGDDGNDGSPGYTSTGVS